MSLNVKLEPREVTVAPGAETRVIVTITNTADRVEHYTVSLQGLPEGHDVHARPELTKLQPNQSGDVEVTIRADDARPPLAGRAVVGVVARSPYRRDVMRVAELSVVTSPAPQLEASITPELLTGGANRATLELHNHGNIALDVVLTGRDTEGKVVLEFEPERLRISARQAAQIGLRLSARRPLSGGEVRRQVTVVANSQAGVIEKPIVMAQKPLVPGGAGRLTMAAAGVAVMAGALITSAVLVVSKVGGDTSQTASTSPGSSSAGPSSGGSSTAPTGSPSVTTSDTESATTTTSTTTTAPPVGADQVFDLSQPPPGSPAVDQLIDAPDAYPGLVLSVLKAAPGTTCADETGVSFLQLDGARYGVAAGSFGPDTSGKVGGHCNSLPLRIGVPRASQVTVQFIAQVQHDSPAKLLSFQLQAGNQTVSADNIGIGSVTSLTILDTTGQGITAVVVSGVPPSSFVIPVVTKVTVTPMP